MKSRFVFFSSGILQPAFRWKQGFVCAFGLEEGNGIKPHHFLGDEVEEYEAALICKMIAATPWKTLGLFGERGVSSIFMDPCPAAVGWICTIPSSDFFFPSDISFLFSFSHNTSERQSKHLLNVEWISSQKMPRISQLRAPSGDGCGCLSSNTGMGSQLEYCPSDRWNIVTSPSILSPQHPEGTGEKNRGKK